jgi:eukaryotic-like serine/threonine-protein kinase
VENNRKEVPIFLSPFFIPPSPFMIWSPGKVLSGDRYTIEKVLDHGRLSVTYLARKKNGDRHVLKVPNDEATRSDFDRVQQRFVKEVFKLQRCDHPNIVKVFEPFYEGEVICIPMGYIAGTTLDQRNPMRLPEADAMTYVTQIGEALGEMHGKGLIHRDVNPRNVMIRSGVTQAVLIDFGLVKDFSLESSPSSVTTTTQDAGINPGYKAPELYVPGGDRGPFCDLYALGALLYELVTGSAPPNAVERTTQPGPLSFPGGAVSDRVMEAIECAMALKVSDRPDTVAEWLDLLKSGKKPEVKPSQPEPETAKSVDWKLGLKVLAGITAFITAVTGLVTAFQPKESPPAKTEQSR